MNPMEETDRIAASLWDVADEYDLQQERSRLFEVETEVTPVLDAYDWIDGHGLAIWCRYCRKWHVHGHGGGHRLAHCLADGSPYINGGYVLKPIGKPVPKYKNGRPKPAYLENHAWNYRV